MREHDSTTGRIDRRTLLRVGASVGALVVAGCLGDDADEPADDAADPTPTPTDADDSDGTPSEPDDGDEPETALPVTGEITEELQVLDEPMVEFMQGRDVQAGTLSVVRDDELVVERGYGWADPELTAELPPETRFRIGSLSKRFTDDAVLRLVDAGDLALDEEVYPLLDVEPPGGDLADDRIEEITVEHLLNHAGGWNRFEHANPLFNPQVVVDDLGLDGPPERDDFVRYMLGQPLQFEPGTDDEYSNIGYVVLSLVIEQAAGTSYQSFLDREVFDPAGVDVSLVPTRPEDRPADEVWYDDDERCPDLYGGTDEEVACADYGLVVDAFSGAGGHVASAPDLARALDELQWFWVGGEAYDSTEELFEAFDVPTLPWFGSLPGSFSYGGLRPDGWVVALFNRRSSSLRTWQQDIVSGLDDAFERTAADESSG